MGAPLMRSRRNPRLVYLFIAKPKKGSRKMALVPVHDIFMHPYFWSAP